MSETPADTETLFVGHKFNLERVPVQMHDGQTMMREAVRHPGAVALVPVLDDGRIVLIREHRFVVGEYLWSLCAGTIEPGEDLSLTAGRELIEETGYRAGKLEPLCTFFTSPGFCDEKMHVFLATDLEHVGQQLEPYEYITVQPIEPDEVWAMLRDGRISDGKSIAALLYYRQFILG